MYAQKYAKDSISLEVPHLITGITDLENLQPIFFEVVDTCKQFELISSQHVQKYLIITENEQLLTNALSDLELKTNEKFDLV